tara:strand:+ start:3691 stop:4626 length:936 start_codon:yes stop_codon:yes gene_type:complete
MFSVIFPGQGSQIVGMGKDFYHDFSEVKNYFERANDLLNKDLTKIIFENPNNELGQTENTQPAIFLISYSIFKTIEKETQFNIKGAKYFAGHSLGEYSALCCANSLSFDQTISLLKYRGKAMQNAVPNGEGGMVAVLGANIDNIKKILEENKDKYSCYIANDNSIGQIVVSGKIDSIDYFSQDLKKNKIKYIKLPVSAPFHCPLMKNATNDMKSIILETEFKDPTHNIISNVTAKPVSNSDQIKKLLIEQIEKPVRWRESVLNMIGLGINQFIEVGPGKVLSSLVKRIDRNINSNHINILADIKNLSNDRS